MLFISVDTKIPVLLFLSKMSDFNQMYHLLHIQKLLSSSQTNVYEIVSIPELHSYVHVKNSDNILMKSISCEEHLTLQLKKALLFTQ